MTCLLAEQTLLPLTVPENKHWRNISEGMKPFVQSNKASLSSVNIWLKKQAKYSPYGVDGRSFTKVEYKVKRIYSKYMPYLTAVMSSTIKVYRYFVKIDN